MQLHAAAARGDLNGMAFALNAGTDINSRNSVGQTALVFALERAGAFSRRRGPNVSLEAVKFLLKAGADLEISDSLGATAIHHSARISDPQFLELLIDRGANPRHITKSGYSVLLHACFQPASPAKHAIIERLHAEGACLNEVSEHGESAVSVCLRFGDFRTLRQLLEFGADPGPLNWSELHRAVALNELPAITRLSPSSADLNAINRRFELSPWLVALIRGDLRIVRPLAELGADLTQAGRCGESALHLSAEFGHVELMHWLLELGADANSADNSAETPLHRAAEWNHLACARALLERGADASRPNHVQSQPIHAARTLEVIQLLVQSGGADVNAVDGCGEWPLKSAAEDNDVERIQWLLEQGAEVDCTSTGETALHQAVRSDSREAVAILLQSGADPNAQDVDGQTSLCDSLSREVIATLLNAGADPRITDQASWGPEKWLKDPILIKALREKL